MRKLAAVTLASVAALTLGAGAAFASPGPDHQRSQAATIRSHDRGSPDRSREGTSRDRHGQHARCEARSVDRQGGREP